MKHAGTAPGHPARRTSTVYDAERNEHTLKAIITILQMLSCLFLIAVVLLQSGKRAGLSGAISGAADTFLAKNQAKSWDAKLAKMTTWVAIGFIILTLALSFF